MLPDRACSVCGVIKPSTAENFAEHPQCRDGLTRQCRDCVRASARIRAANDPAGARRRYIRYRAFHRLLWDEKELAKCEVGPIRKRARYLSESIFRTCRERDWPKPKWVTIENIYAWLLKQRQCVCCGRPFTYTINPKPRASTPTFDRFDASRGYTLDNVNLVCWRCNNVKRNFTPQDLLLVAAWVIGRTAEIGAARGDLGSATAHWDENGMSYVREQEPQE